MVGKKFRDILFVEFFDANLLFLELLFDLSLSFLGFFFL